MVHSDGCAFPDQARRFYDRLAGPRRLTWLGGTHFDYYDSAVHLDHAVDEITDFLQAVPAR